MLKLQEKDKKDYAFTEKAIIQLELHSTGGKGYAYGTTHNGVSGVLARKPGHQSSTSGGEESQTRLVVFQDFVVE